MLAGNAFKHSRQVLVCPFLVCFLLCLVRSHRTNRTCMSSCISWHHSCWAETTKSPKTTQILQQVGKTTNLEYQGISYESGLKQQPLLSAVLINYSWFVSHPELSWHTHPMLVFADQISPSHALSWQLRREFPALTLHSSAQPGEGGKRDGGRAGRLSAVQGMLLCF